MTSATDGTSDQPFSLTDWVVADATAFVTPLLEATSGPDAMASLLAAIGWQVDAVPQLSALVTDVASAVTTALSALYSAGDAAEAGPSTGTALANVQGLIGLVQSVSNAIATFSQAASWQGAPQGLAMLAEDMLAWLTDNYLLTAHPLLHGALALLQLLTPQSAAPEQPAVLNSSGQIVRAAYRLPALHFDRIGALLKDPATYLRNAYMSAGGLLSPADVQQFADALFPVVADALNTFGLGATYGLDPYFDELGLDAATTSTLQRSVSIWLLDSDDSDATRLGATFVLVGPDASTGGQIGALVAPTFPTSIDGTMGGWHFTATLMSAGAPLSVISWTPYPADPSTWPGLGVSLALQTGTTDAASPSATPPAAQLEVGLAVSGSMFDASLSLGLQGSAALSPADLADGFLQQVLPANGVVFPLGLTLKGSRSGWELQSSATDGSAIVLAKFAPMTIGPLGIDNLRFQVTPGAGGLTVGGYLSASLSLGPVAASVQSLGIGLTVQWPAAGGNAGPLNVEPTVLWPTGVGLALQAPPVSGTGFLAYSATDGRYLGAVALMAGDVAISAVGVLDTRLPGGASGYSLLIVASATFPPIELGFGFSLSGIGGLVGVNRTADVPSLQALARAGRLDDLMFPADLIHRAPQVAANLAQQFPAAQGHFIVGPAVQIEWGTGGMLYADIGVFIELTDSGGGITVLRVALLGLVHFTLPGGDAPVADITLDVLGVLDFAAQTLSLDAGLRNSTIATFPLTGQAALRAGWGTSPEFLFAIGGFNPHFQAPTGFPSLQRIALAIGGDNPRLRLSAYLALTSNTLQLGCTADLYAAASVAGVTAAVTASLSFDALVQFKPFGLIVDLTIAAAILVNNSPVMSLNLDLHVTGPQPWTVTGAASFHFLFLSITVPISITAGPALPPQPAQTVDLDSNLIAALTDLHSWATGPPTGRGLVHVRSQSTAQPAVHPLGSLTVRQHSVPLAQRIDRYGPDLLDAPCQYAITSADLGSHPITGTAVTDFFAPAQFLTMTDAAKLSAPSFETMSAGIAIGSTQLTVPAASGAVVAAKSTVAWDTLVIDIPDQSQPSSGGTQPVVTPYGAVTVPDTVLAAQLSGASTAVNGPTGAAQARYSAPGCGIAVEQPTYAVVGMNLRAPGTASTITVLRIGSVAAGQTVSAASGYVQDSQVVYTSEVPS